MDNFKQYFMAHTVKVEFTDKLRSVPEKQNLLIN
jgi:hypothetical protein